MTDPHDQLLDSVEIFRKLPEGSRRQVLDRVREERFDEDEIIFRAGDPATCMYVVRVGAVDLFTDRIGEPIELRAQIGTGGVFGELGVLENAPRSLTARATEASRLLRLDGSELLRLAREHEPFLSELIHVAIGYSVQNRHAKAELARRREARIRIGRPVELRIAGRQPLPVVLENLSLGGAGLSEVPAGWQLDPQTLLSVGTDPATALFSVYAKVVWRKEDEAGLCFVRTLTDHQLRISLAIRRFVSEDPSPR